MRVTRIDGTGTGERGGGTAQTTLLGSGLGLGTRVIVHALGLEEDGVLRVPPKVRHRVAAVAAARDDLQSAVAAPIRARLACYASKECSVPCTMLEARHIFVYICVVALKNGHQPL